MQVFKSIADWREFRKTLPRDAALGFVPTMGALHPGHASLVSRSRVENKLTAVSIFVNPTQFNDPKDLEKYPRTLDADLQLLQTRDGERGVDFVICPSAGSASPKSHDELYPDHYRYRVSESEDSRLLCGAHRPGHFDGVLTVVMKLLNLVQANRAYFGEKDFQQLSLIRGMTEAFFMPVEIIPCPTVRDEDGLAMSSRNARLQPEERARAAAFPRLLGTPGLSTAETRAALERAGFTVDYVADHFDDQGGRRYGAVHLGTVRLIDNFPYATPHPTQTLSPVPSPRSGSRANEVSGDPELQ